MSAEGITYYDEEDYVDVRSLPLRPPQKQLPAEKASRRVWHPVMWDDGQTEQHTDSKQEIQTSSKEYPHKKQIRNIKRLVAEGKVKPTQESLIFFLCNKFAISEERQSRMASNQ
ncbi:uncharacterized protein LOC126965143 [Leptidea sinapis]|uniref:uncharacterized protein LOC126965143 n=1 Tax=Leptidea sinapis TaxID=189913 RepID=UPI00213909A4|nr:uncharacterized protein LOC126965143 [Leptidea sinapis]